MNSDQKNILKGNKRVQGFTLIELLIGLMIIGILTAIAYPSYRSYILKSHRSDALATLTRDQIILERCYAQDFSYNVACAALPTFPQTSPQGFYSITISNRGVSTYTLKATTIGTQVKDTKCASMTVNQANVKTANDSSAASQSSCWNPT